MLSRSIAILAVIVGLLFATVAHAEVAFLISCSKSWAAGSKV